MIREKYQCYLPATIWDGGPPPWLMAQGASVGGGGGSGGMLDMGTTSLDFYAPSSSDPGAGGWTGLVTGVGSNDINPDIIPGVPTFPILSFPGGNVPVTKTESTTPTDTGVNTTLPTDTNITNTPGQTGASTLRSLPTDTQKTNGALLVVAIIIIISILVKGLPWVR